MNPQNILHILIICLTGILCKSPSEPGDSGFEKVLSRESQPGAMQLAQYLPLLQDKSVACVVNHTSLVGEKHLIDTLLRLGIEIRRAFSPEHGFRGGASDGEKISDDRDSSTGVPIISLYGDRRKPLPSDLEGIDVVLFDVQDVGARFYTYISTLHLVMEACAENEIPIIVLDRPNPNGYYVDGPVLKPEFRSFVGTHEIPVVYGMTTGELAQMINGEKWLANQIQCNLTVVPCRYYDHTMTYDLPVAASPNLPNLRSVLLYPSLCFFEGTQVSVGRGTNEQFQVLGHPDNRLGSYTFTPQSMSGAINPPQNGIQLYGTNLTTLTIEEIRSWKKLNLTWLIDYHQILAEKNTFFLENRHAFDRLAGTDELRMQLEAGWTEEQIRASWRDELDTFLAKRKKYLLYPDFDE